MVKKRGKFKNLLKNNILSLVVFIGVLFITVVIAGNVIVQDGQLTVDNNINTGYLNVTRVGGTDSTFAKFSNSVGDFIQFVQSNGIYIDIRDSALNSKARISSNGSSFFNGGNVGIGTISPLLQLDVSNRIGVGGVSNFEVNTRLINVPFVVKENYDNITSSGSNGTFMFVPGSPGSVGDAVGFYLTALDNNVVDLNIGRKHSGDTQFIKHITYKSATGNLGIGTEYPTHKLNVVGDINVTGNIYHGGSLIEYSPLIVESADNGQSIIGMKADNGLWVGCSVYYDSVADKYDWKCSPMQEVDDKINKIETRKNSIKDCESRGLVFNEIDKSCFSQAD